MSKKKNSTNTKVSTKTFSSLETASTPNPLTPREFTVLQLIVEGYKNKEIAHQLKIEVGTVKAHVRSIVHKLDVENRITAAIYAIRSGLIK